MVEYFRISSKEKLPPSMRIQYNFDYIVENIDSSQKELITVGKFELGRALYESMKRDENRKREIGNEDDEGSSGRGSVKFEGEISSSLRIHLEGKRELQPAGRKRRVLLDGSSQRRVQPTTQR